MLPRAIFGGELLSPFEVQQRANDDQEADHEPTRRHTRGGHRTPASKGIIPASGAVGGAEQRVVLVLPVALPLFQG